MIIVNILTKGFDSPNGLAFLFPIILFKSELKYKFKIKIYTTINKQIENCDFLLIESKYFRSKWQSSQNQILKQFRDWKEKQIKVIFCDTTDSASWLKSDIIEHVYKYAKGQLLNDKNLYLKPIYANRVYAEYYHNRKKVSDKNIELSTPINKGSIKKLCLSWNSGLSNYSVLAPLLYRYIPLNFAEKIFKFSRKFVSPDKPRDLINCRFGNTYHLESIRYQRNEIRRILSDYTKTDKLNRLTYFKEMQRSLVSIVPFGYGEITLKDFESFLNGCILMKPKMTHMKTWPNFYIANETFVPFSWNLNDLRNCIETVKRNYEKFKEISVNGQELYKKYTVSKEAPELFTEHFEDLVS